MSATYALKLRGLDSTKERHEKEGKQMNSVNLIGRLTRDPEVRYTQNNMAVATFTLAIDRPVKKDGEKQTDFPRVICFGKTAELVEKYVTKGRQVAVQGRIQTGSYQKDDGTTVYTTDVVADRVEFLGSKTQNTAPAADDTPSDVPPSFAALDDEDCIPF